ncbi:SPOR domain-containing protein [Pseudactinotalea sp.]|uniref:SPOR domain-containing protein n=1 Tax=Pseudactinotalea sp. TaxID=1926260 RepID=UPI003B3BADE2
MPTESLDPQSAYYFNTETSQVEQGYQSDWTNRMGPYRTREEAEKALATAAQRNQDWDDADREWNGDEDN